MAKLTTSGTKTAAPAGDQLPGPELAALLPLVRLLAREAAREAWSAQAKDLTHHDDQDHPARP